MPLCPLLVVASISPPQPHFLGVRPRHNPSSCNSDPASIETTVMGARISLFGIGLAHAVRVPHLTALSHHHIELVLELSSIRWFRP